MAADPIRIEYNQSLEPLEKLLSGVDRSGDFFVEGTVEIPLPKVEVDGVGILSFPVPEAQVRQLVSQATRAPYGRGEETVLDESVRKVWQLPPDKVRLGGKSWAANFGKILEQVAAGLGCEGMAVRAELYKLLVYDTGGFFLAHRDTEKTAGMFGTLVLVLPAVHRGGDLVLRHAGREATVDMSRAEVSEIGFAAFYADCEHEVRPITEGNRVCLVFNLVQDRGPGTGGRPLLAPDHQGQAAVSARLLEKELSRPGAPTKIAWLLEHQYSPEGLSFAGLKSADAARVKVLSQAAEQAGCEVHLGIVHIVEEGAAETTYDCYPRRRSWGSRRDDDEDQPADSGGDDFEIIEVTDRRHRINCWRDRQDSPVELGEIPLEAGELLPDGSLDGEKPDQQRLMEASGNEGASFERSYRRAALVLWRRERHAEVLLQAGVDSVLPHLRRCVEACEAPDAPPSARKAALAVARQTVDKWRQVPVRQSYHQPLGPARRDGMAALLQRLGDVPLLEGFIADVVTRDYDGSDNAALVENALFLGGKRTGKLYGELVRKHFVQMHGPCMELLRALASKTKLSAGKPGREALLLIAEAAVAQIDEIGKQRAAHAWMDWRAAGTVRPVDAALVAGLLAVTGELGAAGLRDAAVAKLAARPDVFDPVTVLVPALESVRDRSGAGAGLWEHCASFLLQRSGRPPEAPVDWRQDVEFSCSCADCLELRTFTSDPVERTHRFRVRQDRRQHLHQIIERHGLDMTHVTERKGSPQTLVCTKDRRGYLRRSEQYRGDVAALGRLADLARRSGTESKATLGRVAAARTAAGGWSPG